jgi:hypothetical protein
MSAAHPGRNNTIRKHIVNTTNPRTKFVRAAVLAGATATLALSTPAAHAAPGDGQDDTPSPPNSLQLQTPANPLFCKPFSNGTMLWLTWNHPPGAALRLEITKDGAHYSGGPLVPEFTEFGIGVDCGHTYAAHLENDLTHEVGPTLTIPAKWRDAAMPSPEINPTLIPNLPSLTPGGTRG